MLGRKCAFLASTALVASLAVGGCADEGVLAPQEFVPLGLPVGEPIEIVSATKGDGVSFDAFTVTFNDASGTDLTITTPEGEEINFTEADLEWQGEDADLGGMNIARLTSSGGDRLDVVVGEAYLPPDEGAEDGEDVDVLYGMRLDEADTRNGFETYGVVGKETDKDALPRYQTDVIVNPDTPGEQEVAAGELAQGSAWYYGDFLASVFKEGELVTDNVAGNAMVEIGFAENDVWIGMEGDYVYDDVDDVAQGAITGFALETKDIGGETFVTGISGFQYTNNGAYETVVTGVTVHRTILGIVSDVTANYGSLWDNDMYVSSIQLSTDTIDGVTVVTDVTPVMASTENDDIYHVSLSGSGSATDLNLGFDGTVEYSGELEGIVEMELAPVGGTDIVGVGGEFAGAVFGPGSDAETVDPANFDDVVGATATAGVFEADSGVGEDGGDPQVQVVGGYVAEASDTSFNDFVPVPEPEPEPVVE